MKKSLDPMPNGSVYESWTLENLVKELHSKYEINSNGDFGSYSGRDRFLIKCLKCGEVIHPSTTYPTYYIECHEEKCCGL